MKKNSILPIKEKDDSKAIILSKMQKSKLGILLKCGKYFALTPNSLVVIGSPSISEWKKLGRFLNKAEGSVHWWIGDWLNLGEALYKERKAELKKVLSELGFDFKDSTLRNDKYVAKQVKVSWRHDKLTWDHHHAIAPLPEEEQEFWLEKAERAGWSVSSLRKEIAGSSYLSWLRYTDVWNFEQCDERFGLGDFPGKIPGQIIQNVLYYYTKEKDFVIDPMAGGGTTLDVCKSMKRKCLSFDINPVSEALKKGILKADASESWPNKKEADLIFIDPPYWSQKEKNYQGISSKEYSEYLIIMNKVFKEAETNLKKEGKLAVLIAPMSIKSEYKEIMFDFYHQLLDLDFTLIKRVQIPVGIHQASPQVIEQCKLKKIMIAQVRDLLIFKKLL